MGRSVLILQCHPDPAGGHLCNALADAYAEGADAGGHRVARVEIAALDFPLLRNPAEFEAAPVPAPLQSAGDALLAAEHVVLVFPLWLGTMPALMKGFLEQLFRPGFAFDYDGPGFPKKRLSGRSARVIVTMGMPSLIYRWYFLAHGVMGLERSILRFAGFSPVRHTFFGMVGSASDERRKSWLEAARDLGLRAH